MAATLAPSLHDATNTISGYHDAVVDDFRQDLGFDTNGPAEPSFQNVDPNVAQARDVDEEVQIKKKRKPVPKLDEARLLSADGIPRLRKIAKSSKVRFKGKGHEFSDIGNLLSTYQFWLDDLFPKAKFRDALTIVEKLGHSRRMQVTRRAWIDETKPRGRDASPERMEDQEEPQGNDATANEQDDADMVHEDANSRPNDIPDDNDLAALLAEHDTGNAIAPRPQAPRRAGPFDDDSDEDDGPDADELDAMLAEHTAPRPPPTKPRMPFEEDEEEGPDQDELDALLAEQDRMDTPPSVQPSAGQRAAAQEHRNEGPDEDEQDALMAEQAQDQSTPRPDPEHVPLTSSQPISVGEDELDALMDEQDSLARPT